MNCPKCNGQMWDNRRDKKNPKSPDFKCKNRECGHAIWEKPFERKGNGAATPGNVAHGKYTWAELSRLYATSLLIAEKHTAAMASRVGGALAHDAVLSATATIFIAATREGVRDVPKPKPPPPPPVEAEEEFDETEDPY